MTKLSPKQERFAQNIALGMHGTNAYEDAYNSRPDIDRQQLAIKASKLLAQSKVSSRVAEIKAETMSRYTWTREQSIAVLAEIALDSEAARGDRISATKELNVMHGFNAPIKVDVSGGVEVTTIELVAPKEVLAQVVSEQ